jgi:hypothetical protein
MSNNSEQVNIKNSFNPKYNFLGQKAIVGKPLVNLSQEIKESITKSIFSPIKKCKTMVTGLAGIYKIECHAANAVYIGQSSSIENRIKNHRSALRSGKHVCDALQADFKKYGESNFLFESIHESDDQNLLNLETFYIQQFIDEGFELYNTVVFTNNIGMVQCNKENRDLLQKISDMLDSGKIKKGELEEALYYKQNPW